MMEFSTLADPFRFNQLDPGIAYKHVKFHFPITGHSEVGD
jgi:hypothetical protein